jgi:hypothetical protein
MAEIAMVLRGDMMWFLVMTGKRDELRFGFAIVDEASGECPRVAVNSVLRKKTSSILNDCSSPRRISCVAVLAVWQSVRARRL